MDVEQGQTRLILQGRIAQHAQIFFSPIQQACFEEIQGQRIPGPVPVRLAQISTGQQVLVDSHSPFKFAPPAKQITQSEMQLRRVGVLLYGLNKSINGLVLLLVEQMIQTLEIGLGLGAVLYTQLAQVQSRGEPTQTKGQR